MAHKPCAWSGWQTMVCERDKSMEWLFVAGGKMLLCVASHPSTSIHYIRLRQFTYIWIEKFAVLLLLLLAHCCCDVIRRMWNRTIVYVRKYTRNNDDDDDDVDYVEGCVIFTRFSSTEYTHSHSHTYTPHTYRMCNKMEKYDCIYVFDKAVTQRQNARNAKYDTLTRLHKSHTQIFCFHGIAQSTKKYCRYLLKYTTREKLLFGHIAYRVRLPLSPRSPPHKINCSSNEQWKGNPKWRKEEKRIDEQNRPQNCKIKCCACGNLAFLRVSVKP